MDEHQTCARSPTVFPRQVGVAMARNRYLSYPLPPPRPPTPPTPAISCATCASLCARRDLICYRNAVSIIVVIVPTLPVVSPSGVLLYFNDPSSRSFLPANVKYFFFFSGKYSSENTGMRISLCSSIDGIATLETRMCDCSSRHR